MTEEEIKSLDLDGQACHVIVDKPEAGDERREIELEFMDGPLRGKIFKLDAVLDEQR